MRTDAGHYLRGVSPSRLRFQIEKVPQSHEFRPPLAGRTGIGGLPGTGALGAGRGRWAFPLSELPQHGGATLRAGAARGDRVYVAARVGLRADRYSRIPGPAAR